MKDTALEHVIDRTDLIENILNQVIEAYLMPRKEARQFLWDILLDSSILSLGAKVRVAGAMSQKLNIKLDQCIHNVVNLRNAFAHHATNAHPVIEVGKTRDADELHYTLKVISSSGHVTRTRREEALAKFDDSYAKAKKSLLALLAAIRASEGASASDQQ